MCGTTPPRSVHDRLTTCPAWYPKISGLWLSSREDWRPHAAQWLQQVELADRHHLGRLRIPESFLEQISVEDKAQLRYRVGWHQYHMLIGVTQLRKELSKPPRTREMGQEAKKETTWSSKLKARRVSRNLTLKNL